jgi:phenylacetic acid degradation protein PaaD
MRYKCRIGVNKCRMAANKCRIGVNTMAMALSNADALGAGNREADAVARRVAAVMWADDSASQALGMGIVDIGAGHATLTMTVRADMTNGHGICHGGFMFSLADSAFAFACNSHNHRAVAQACDIVFLAPVRVGDELVATAVERMRDGRNGICDVTVRRGDVVVAEFRGQSRLVNGPLLDEEPGEDGDS